MKSTKGISIVTPTLNQGQYIDQCIDSVLSQDYKNLQFIIIDGGSTDNTIDIIKKYDKYIDFWISKADNGQSHAINKGLKRVKGEIFNWLNSDDYLEKGSLQVISEAFSDPTVDIVSGNSNLVKSVKTVAISKGLDIYPDSLAKTIGMARIDQPETYWRVNVLKQLGPLSQDLNYIMDRDWWVRYLLKNGHDRVKQIDSVLANFRLHENSKTVSQSGAFNKERNQYFQALAAHASSNILDNIFDNHENLPSIDFPEVQHPNLVNNAINYFLFQVATEFYEQSKFEKFKKAVKNIEKNMLERNDSAFLNKIERRAKLIPARIHKTAKRFT